MNSRFNTTKKPKKISLSPSSPKAAKSLVDTESVLKAKQSFKNYNSKLKPSLRFKNIRCSDTPYKDIQSLTEQSPKYYSPNNSKSPDSFRNLDKPTLFKPTLSSNFYSKSPHQDSSSLPLDIYRKNLQLYEEVCQLQTESQTLKIELNSLANKYEGLKKDYKETKKKYKEYKIYSEELKTDNIKLIQEMKRIRNSDKKESDDLENKAQLMKKFHDMIDEKTKALTDLKILNERYVNYLEEKTEKIRFLENELKKEKEYSKLLFDKNSNEIESKIEEFSSFGKNWPDSRNKDYRERKGKDEVNEGYNKKQPRIINFDLERLKEDDNFYSESISVIKLEKKISIITKENQNYKRENEILVDKVKKLSDDLKKFKDFEIENNELKAENLELTEQIEYNAKLNTNLSEIVKMINFEVKYAKQQLNSDDSASFKHGKGKKDGSFGCGVDSTFNKTNSMIKSPKGLLSPRENNSEASQPMSIEESYEFYNEIRIFIQGLLNDIKNQALVIEKHSKENEYLTNIYKTLKAENESIIQNFQKNSEKKTKIDKPTNNEKIKELEDNNSKLSGILLQSQDFAEKLQKKINQLTENEKNFEQKLENLQENNENLQENNENLQENNENLEAKNKKLMELLENIEKKYEEKFELLENHYSNIETQQTEENKLLFEKVEF